VATAVFGVIFLVLGIVVLLVGEPLLEQKVEDSMAIEPNSDRLRSWLMPPVQAHLTGYAWHIQNPDEVLKGAKPKLEERGPYVYKAVYVKDTEGMIWSDDSTDLTYRPRRFYTYDPELSGEGLDPYKDFVTVPNIPLWTGLSKIPDGSKATIRPTLTDVGWGTPFVNVSFDGLLWGYQDELPCLPLDVPKGCSKGNDPFSSADDAFEDADDGWDFKRRKRSLSDKDYRIVEKPDSIYRGKTLPKAEFINCTCNWGLFRGRNITLRKPIQFMTGVGDITKRGRILNYDTEPVLNFWEKGSKCDAIEGAWDSSTIPTKITKDMELDIFIALMCRKSLMVYEKDVEQNGVKGIRFKARKNFLGTPDDPDPEVRNPDNACYCLKNDPRFKCFKSGVIDMKPCKRDSMAPLALSQPHFFEADQSFRDALEGMNPSKEKHEFYMDVHQKFGFPIAMRPKFQLNMVIGRYIDPTWDVIAKMPDEIVWPFLWAEDGFGAPSDEMRDAIKFGEEAPKLLTMLGAVVFFVLGGTLLLTSLIYFCWSRNVDSKSKKPKNVEMVAMT